MKFRPCIDLHSGQVKQIVGSTLTDTAAQPSKASTEAKDGSTDLAENFATDRPASDYAHMYQRDRLAGGHVIMLGPGNRDAARGRCQPTPEACRSVGGSTPTTPGSGWAPGPRTLSSRHTCSTMVRLTWSGCMGLWI